MEKTHYSVHVLTMPVNLNRTFTIATRGHEDENEVYISYTFIQPIMGVNSSYLSHATWVRVIYYIYMFFIRFYTQRY